VFSTLKRPFSGMKSQIIGGKKQSEERAALFADWLVMNVDQISTAPFFSLDVKNRCIFLP